MNLKNLFFNKPEVIQTRKRLFISFAMKDKEYRTFLVNQARIKHSPFDFVDMSVKTPWKQDEWKKRCRTKIKRCHGVIVLLSKNSYHASGLRFEAKCADEENIPMIGMQIFRKESKQGCILPELENRDVVSWSWENLKNFVSSL